MVRKSVLFSLAIAALVSIVTIHSQAQSLLTHHVREVTLNGQAQSLGRLAANQIMQLDVVLPLSDQAGLDAFLKDLYDPSSPSYHQYLTVAQFTERFGPGQEAYAAALRIQLPSH
jgi:kumamolisin